jgi:hypothetical protein
VSSGLKALKWESHGTAIKNVIERAGRALCYRYTTR